MLNGLLIDGTGSNPLPNAAIVSGIGDQVGALEAGKIADVLIVSGNPLDDLQNLPSIQMVIHNGQVIRDESQNP